jgi:hypothetical protein
MLAAPLQDSLQEGTECALPHCKALLRVLWQIEEAAEMLLQICREKKKKKTPQQCKSMWGAHYSCSASHEKWLFDNLLSHVIMA